MRARPSAEIFAERFDNVRDRWPATQHTWTFRFVLSLLHCAVGR